MVVGRFCLEAMDWILVTYGYLKKGGLRSSIKRKLEFWGVQIDKEPLKTRMLAFTTWERITCKEHLNAKYWEVFL